MMNTEITKKSVATYTAEVYIAGDYGAARQILQRMAAGEGMCVSVEKVDYIYTGGAELGLVVRCVNYPRFPSNSQEVKDFSLRIAECLIRGLGQSSCTVVCSDETIFMSRRQND